MDDDAIVKDSARQRAWRAAKMRELIENQTPSEILERQTGTSVPRFGIDGLEGLGGQDGHEGLTTQNIRSNASPENGVRIFSQDDINSLAMVIGDEVFLLPEHGLIFTRQQLAAELGVTLAAMEAMTDEGYGRLGLTRIKPQKNSQ